MSTVSESLVMPLVPADPYYGSQVNMAQGPIPTVSLDAAIGVWRAGEFSAMGMSHALSIGQGKFPSTDVATKVFGIGASEF